MDPLITLPLVIFFFFILAYVIVIAPLFILHHQLSRTRVLYFEGMMRLVPSTFGRLLLVLMFLALAGLPPFWGFFAKFLLIATNSTQFLLFLPAFTFLILASIYFYFLNVRHAWLVVAVPHVVRDVYRTSRAGSRLLLSLLLLNVGGLFFFDDVFLLLQWLLL